MPTMIAVRTVVSDCKEIGLSTGAAKRAEQNGPSEQSNVRFADGVEEFRPEPGRPTRDVKSAQANAELEEMTPEAREEIRRLAMSQQKSRIQEQRASHFAYDTFSLPASRVSHAETRFHTREVQEGHDC